MANNRLRLHCKCGNDDGGFPLIRYTPGGWEARAASVPNLNAFLLEHVHNWSVTGQDQWFIEYESEPEPWDSEVEILTY